MLSSERLGDPPPTPPHTPVKPPSAPWGRASSAACPSASAVWNQFTGQTSILPGSEIEHVGPTWSRGALLAMAQSLISRRRCEQVL